MSKDGGDKNDHQDRKRKRTPGTDLENGSFDDVPAKRYNKQQHPNGIYIPQSSLHPQIQEEQREQQEQPEQPEQQQQQQEHQHQQEQENDHYSEINKLLAKLHAERIGRLPHPPP